MIKKLLQLSLIISIFAFCSCNKDNEELFKGKWQLRYIDMPNNTQISTDSVYYNFMSNVFLLQTLSDSDFSALKTHGVYHTTTDSLFMTVTPSYLPEALENPYYGWHTADKNFAIRQLNHSSLILSCNDTIYTFRKF